MDSHTDRRLRMTLLLYTSRAELPSDAVVQGELVKK